MQVDESGQVVTKEQDIINKKVKYIMIKAGLIDDDSKKQADHIKYRAKEVNPKSPYKKNRPMVKYFERPEKIHQRVDAFTHKLVKQSTFEGVEIAKIVQHMMEDRFIDETYLSESEDSDDMPLAQKRAT